MMSGRIAAISSCSAPHNASTAQVSATVLWRRLKEESHWRTVQASSNRPSPSGCHRFGSRERRALLTRDRGNEPVNAATLRAMSRQNAGIAA